MARIQYRERPDYVSRMVAKLKDEDARYSEREIRILNVLDVLRDFDGITLRQLFYQLVSHQHISNTEKEYKRLGSLLTNLRYWGLVDWDAIVDRHRVADRQPEFRDLGELVEAAVSSYRTDWWRDQERYVELWCEKAALAGFLEPIAEKWHVTLMVNKGYSSASAMYGAARRFKSRSRVAQIIYVGDHDPSGLDMVRDIEDRLFEFGVGVEVEHCALTYEQVEQYDLPPNPTKVTDSRAGKYMAEFGETCWEADALPPKVLTEVVENAVVRQIDDMAMFENRKDEDAEEAEKLELAAEDIMGGGE